MKTVYLILKPSDMTLHKQRRISTPTDKSLITVTRTHDIYEIGDLVHVKRHSPSTWESKWGYGICIIKLLTPCSAVLESPLNGSLRNVNIWDIHLANPLGILETENIPICNQRRKTKLLFTNNLPDLKRQELQCWITNRNKPYSPSQLFRYDMKPLLASHCLEKFMMCMMLVNHHHWLLQGFILRVKYILIT